MRIFIYPKDIQVLTEQSLKTCRRVYNEVIEAFGKERKKGLTIKDYALYHGIPEDDIINSLGIKR
jgi:hypothetical protein